MELKPSHCNPWRKASLYITSALFEPLFFNVNTNRPFMFPVLDGRRTLLWASPLSINSLQNWRAMSRISEVADQRGPVAGESHNKRQTLLENMGLCSVLCFSSHILSLNSFCLCASFIFIYHVRNVRVEIWTCGSMEADLLDCLLCYMY